MNLKKKLQVVLTSVALLSLGTSALAKDEAAVLKADNANCPVTGKAVNPEKVFAYSKTMGFCCEKCVASFKKNPAAHLVAVSKAKAGPVNTKCPVTGKAIDEEKTAVHNGQTVGLCCGKCLAKFKKDPAALMAKVVADNPGNEKCPVSGKAVDAEQIVVYTTNVGLCCGKCAAKFKKDPEAIIAKMEKKPEKKAEKE